MGTVKYSGPVASFHCPTEATIRSLKVHFSPKQLGSGTPSPENVREIVGWDGVEVSHTGKNLANSQLFEKNKYIPASGNVGNLNGFMITNFISVKYLHTYIYSGIDTFGNINIRVHGYDIDKNWIKQVQLDGANRKPYNFLITINDENIKFIRISTAIDDHFQFEENSIATSYEPYHGSTTNYEFGVLGKNKFDKSTVTDYYRINGSGEITAQSDMSISDYISVIPGQQYTLTNEGSFGGNRRHAYYDKNKNYIQVIANYSNPMTFTVPNNAYYLRLSLYNDYLSTTQLELSSTATTYEPYDPNKTVYGGWVDLVSGEVQQEYGIMHLDETNNWTGYANVGVKTRVYLDSGANAIASAAYAIVPSVSNKFVSQGQSGYPDENKFCFSNTTEGRMFLGLSSSITSLEDFKTWFGNLGGADFAYELITPITYFLVPTELQTFLGQNNVWSNADYVEVEYDLHETQDILSRKQFIIANQPHVEKLAAAPLQNFVTDMAAPLKECKVYFNPVQEGEGTPSPENIRPITGWTNLSVTHTKNNLLFTNPSEWTNAVWGGVNTQTANNSRLCTITTIPIEPNTTYTINIPNFFLGVNIYNSSGNRIYDSGWKENILTFTTSDTASTCGINVRYPNQGQISPDIVGVEMFPQLEVGDVATEYSPRNTFSINWTDEVGTVYGGYLDLVKGEVVEEWHKIVADGVNVKVNSKYANSHGKIGGGIVYLDPYGNHNDDWLTYTTVLCDILPTVGQSENPGEKTEYLWCARNGRLYVVFFLFNASDFEEEPSKQEVIDMTNNWLQEHPTTIVYKLQTPIHHTLTPETLKTLRGTNNIWSNSNGDITVQFWRH